MSWACCGAADSFCAPAEYVGCFKARDNTEGHLRLRTHRWYDPHHELFEGDASHYAEGAFYVVPGPVIEGIVKSGLVVRQGGPNEGNCPALSPCIQAEGVGRRADQLGSACAQM